MRRLFPPPFVCPSIPPLRSARRSKPGGLLVGEGGGLAEGRIYFSSVSPSYLQLQRELANDIILDIMGQGIRALKLFHGEGSKDEEDEQREERELLQRVYVHLCIVYREV